MSPLPSLGPADLLVQERRGVQDPAPQHRTRQAPLPVPAGEKGKKEPRGEAAQRQFVGNDPVVDVDEGDRQEKGEEEQVAQQRDPGTVQKKERANPLAVNSSTAGYRQEIPPPAPGAFPPEGQETDDGVYSPTEEFARPHPGQRDRGETIDSPRGRRWITTLRKRSDARPDEERRRKRQR